MLKLFVCGYHKNVIKHFNNPKNIGSFNPKNKDVGTGLILNRFTDYYIAIVGAPSCGDVMKLQIKVSKNRKIIKDSCFKTFGCGSAIASSSFATSLIKGMKINQAK
jgi:nitrogen fixation NifU-like protein